MSENLRHVALIMDGNRRWAKARGLSIKEGHEAGYQTFRKIVSEGLEEKIEVLTFYAFSTENWQRPQDQVRDLLAILERTAKMDFDDIFKNNIRLKVIGDLSAFPKIIRNRISKIIDESRGNTAMTVNIALNYGGRNEIVRAANKVAATNQEITEEAITNALDTAGQPDPDLIIRTGGAQRLSNFLLWQCSYSEFCFSDILWPDFTPERFKAITTDFINRERRFGR